jgi:septal ring factor EnvC (AmiA/AmiB activator)
MSAIAVVTFALGMGFFARNEIQTNTQFDNAHRSLNLTRRQIKMVRADLASVRQDLFLVDGQVHQTATALATDTTQLHEVQAALTNAQANVSTQGSDITALQSCLGGVEQALNALSVGDQGSALAALGTVSTSCQSAVAADG